jgi:transcription antitermination factor NusG
MSAMLQKRLTNTPPTSSLFNTMFTQRFFGFRPKQEPIKRWNIVKDDFVQVIAGRYKNTQGKVLRVYRKTNQVLVAGVNLKYKRVDSSADEYSTGDTTCDTQCSGSVSGW